MEVILVIVGIVVACVGFALASEQGSLRERLDELVRRQAEIDGELDRLTRLEKDTGRRVASLIELEAAAEQRIRQLEVRVASAPAEVGQPRSAPEAGVVPAVPRAEGAPAVAPPAAVPAERVPLPAPAAPARPRPAPATPAIAGTIPGWRGPSASPARRAAAAASAAAPEPESLAWMPAPEPGPSGPSLLDRALVAFGLASTEEDARPSRATVEAWLEGRMLAIVGGVALLLGAVFFLSLAFSRGWITEPMRVLIGLVAGGGLLVLGELAFARLRGLVGPVLVAVGLAVISLALFASTRLYGLVAVEWALGGAFAAAIAAAAIAVRHDSQLVAAFGLIAVLAAPPLLGASPTIVTLLFVAATLVGTTAIALFRTWVWLPPVAFVLAAPQVASYVAGGPPVAEALVVVTGFWLVNVIAAGGEEFRHPTDTLRTSTVTLLLADAAFTLWAGFTTLDGPDATWRGAFLAIGALLYLAIALAFLVRNGDRHPFGLIVAATGIAALTMAAPVQAGGPPVPIAWAAEAVALGWVAALRRHPYSAALALLLGAMAIAHLVAFEYPPADLATGIVRDVPFAGPEGITFAFMLAALVVAGVGVPLAWIRVALATIGGLLAMYVFPFELSGPALVAGWSALAAAGIVLHVRVVARHIDPAFRERRVGALALPASIEREVGLAIAGLSAVIRPLFAAAALLAGIAALGHLVCFDYPVGSIVAGTPHAVPFIGLPGLSLAILLAAMATTGILVAVPWIRVSLTALGGLVILYVLPFELSGPALVWAWSALATAMFAIEALLVGPRLVRALAAPPYSWVVRPSIAAVGALAGSAALGHLVVLDFPVADLGERILSTPPFVGPEGLALAGFLAALAASAWLLRALWVRLGAAGIAAALLTYAVTFEVTQPAVTVAWAALTLVSVALVRRIAPVRLLPASVSSPPVTVEPLAGTAGSPLELSGERLPYAAALLSIAFLAVRAYWLADVRAFVEHLVGRVPLTGLPFTDETTFVLALLAATIALTGVIWGGTMARAWGALGAGGVLAWLLPFEVRAAYAVAGWCALALGGIWAVRLIPAARTVLGIASLALGAFAALITVAVVAPPDRLIVDASTTVARLGPLTDATVALGALAIGLAAAAYLQRADPLAMPALAAAGVVAVYLLSVAVVDWFQVQVGTQPLEDLQKSAQVGLSVLWSILGGATFAVGLATRRTPVRLFGLALLGLATVKVFLVDLAALDVAYRVLSLVALGVLLLVSAAVYSRIQHPRGPVSHHPA